MSNNKQWLAGMGIGLLVVIIGLGIYFGVGKKSEDKSQVKGTATATTADLTGLAKHLKDTGAKFYGAYWCHFCQAQKEMFGDAVKELPYVECDPQGENPDVAACEKVGIEGYPTWVINGQKTTGLKSVDDLKQLSGYK